MLFPRVSIRCDLIVIPSMLCIYEKDHSIRRYKNRRSENSVYMLWRFSFCKFAIAAYTLQCIYRAVLCEEALVNMWWRNIIEPGNTFNKVNIRKNKGIEMRGNKVELTKVTRPRLHSTYQRTDLNTLLDELSATPVIVVSGKPGSGKTSLISNYVESRNLPCIWYHVDRGEDDLTKFFYYLSIAALKVNPFNKTILPQVSPERVSRLPSLAKEYFQKLYQSIQTPFMMVFDDYHHLKGGTALNDVISEACAALPPGGRIVLISNSDSNSNLPKLNPARIMARLGYEDLLLSPSEVKEIAAIHGISLPSDHAARQLQVKVGGWLAGLVEELDKLKTEFQPQSQ